MTCKFVKGKDFNAFQCSRIGEFEYMENGMNIEDHPDREPYGRFECDHHSRYDNRGVLTCRDCGATYDDNTLEWREP